MITTFYCIIDDRGKQLFQGSMEECSVEVKKLVVDHLGWLDICKISPVSTHHGKSFPSRREIAY